MCVTAAAGVGRWYTCTCGQQARWVMVPDSSLGAALGSREDIQPSPPRCVFVHQWLGCVSVVRATGATGTTPHPPLKNHFPEEKAGGPTFGLPLHHQPVRPSPTTLTPDPRSLVLRRWCGGSDQRDGGGQPCCLQGPSGSGSIRTGLFSDACEDNIPSARHRSFCLCQL